MTTKEIWVFAETREGALAESAPEAISEGRRLAELSGGELSVVVLGAGVKDALETPFLYGARRVHFADDPRLSSYAAELYTAIVAGIVRAHSPSVFLLIASDVGKDLAPRVAARLGAGLVTNCDKLEFSPEGLLLQTKLSYGGKAHATYLNRTGATQMATIEPGIMKVKKMPSVEARQSDMHSIDPGSYWSCEERVKVVGLIQADPRTVDIADADVIVAGGKGVGDQAGFEQVWKLADVLGGAVAGSRMAVDAGCIGKERQIGQSGKTVSPELLISCGISGANAHVAGMRASKTVIAVNRDKNAPMIKRADLGVVGDARAILPVLIRHLEEHLAKKPKANVSP